MSSPPTTTAQLEEALAYQFSDPSLLKLALRHKSSGRPNNERLEFLGDAILGAVVAESLFLSSDTVAEGNMTVARAQLVNGKSLAKLGRKLGLDRLLTVGKGERSAGAIKHSIIADAVEAVIGAIFLDSDFDVVRSVVLAQLGEKLSALTQRDTIKDAKTELQELMQAQKVALPVYRLVRTEGPDHQRLFTVTCTVPVNAPTTEGTASSRREAEQQAAQAMLLQLQKNTG